MQLSTIRVRYPAFEDIFERHLKDAKLDGVPMKSPDFRDLKLGVISLLNLQGKHKRMRSETRSALIQTLIVERDFQKAFRHIQKISNGRSRWIFSFRSDRGGAEAFKNEMKSAADQVSASQFLLQIESTNDEDLRYTAQDVKAIAQTELASAIDSLVQTMTHDVLAMQQAVYEEEVRRQVENKESDYFKKSLVEFIREINKKSATGAKS